jgi:tetratricopeptide (TPR) repeat protein
MNLEFGGNTDALTEFIKWLAVRKDWKAIDEVATRFEPMFSNNAELLYTIAEAHLTAGHSDLADQTAKKALQLNPDKPLEHYKVATQLQFSRGLIRWADEEYRRVIALATPPQNTDAGFMARFFLSENQHDRQEDKEAAETLEAAVELMDKNMPVMKMVQKSGRAPEQVRARMYFFQGEDARRRGENDKAIKCIESALAQDEKDVDCLISLYRLSLAPERRTKLLETIHEVIDESRRGIEQEPTNPFSYNQMAWLIANTEGDIDEAIRASQKSIEIKRASGEFKSVGGYIDTLAHCYYAKKDYASAVKYQSEAAALEPGNASINRQLKVFQAALAKTSNN